MDHLQLFLDALHRGDQSALAEHLSPDVVLRSPIFEQPFEGRDKVLAVLKVLTAVADKFQVDDIVRAGARAVVFVTITAGDVVVEGVDDMRTDADGFVSRMSIMWRPLPAIVQIQQKLAPILGVPELMLVEA